MKTTTLFRTLWRANAVIIFGAGVVVLVLGLIAGYYMLRELRHGDRAHVIHTENVDSGETLLTLGVAQPIEGHPWMLVPLDAGEHYDRDYPSKGAGAVRNYVFISGSLETRWLYPHSRFLIVEAIQLPVSAYDKEPNATSLVSFVVVQQDTDGDRELTPQDSSSLVFTRPDGTSATTVLENVTEIVSQELLGDAILVIYTNREGYAAATFSLKDFSPVIRERLELPPSGS